MVHVTVMLIYLAVVIGIIIFLIDAFRRLVRAAEQIAVASARQAQALEIVANRCEVSKQSKGSSDKEPQ